MPSLKELIDRRAKLIRDSRALLNKCDAEKRDLTLSEKGEYDSRDSEIDSLSDQIEANRGGGPLDFETGPDRYERMLSAPPMRQTRPSDPNGRLGRPHDTEPLDLALSAWVRNACGVPIPNEEFRACERFGTDPRSSAFQINMPLFRPTIGANISFSGVQTLGQIKASDPRGGYTVAHGGFLGSLEKALALTAPMLMVSQVISTNDGHSMSWPTLDDVSAEGELLVEEQEADDDEISFGKYEFGAYKLSSKMLKASHQLVRDSGLALASELGTALGERLGRGLNRACTTGSGAGTAQGFIAGATVGKTAALATSSRWTN